jgi:hypothetical protein
MDAGTADIIRLTGISFKIPNKGKHLTQEVAVSYWGLYTTLVLVAQNIFQMSESINVTRPWLVRGRCR